MALSEIQDVPEAGKIVGPENRARAGQAPGGCGLRDFGAMEKFPVGGHEDPLGAALAGLRVGSGDVLDGFPAEVLRESAGDGLEIESAVRNVEEEQAAGDEALPVDV